jgi:hypothetical protein
MVPETGGELGCRMSSRYLATCIPGTAKILASELDWAGCWDIEVSGSLAVHYSARKGYSRGSEDGAAARTVLLV